MGKKDEAEAGLRGSATANDAGGLSVAVARGSLGMDALREFLEDLKRQEATRQHFRGLLHILIGRRITKADGTVISNGMTWRELAVLFKKVRWDKHFASQVGLNPEELPPRDRERYWYTIIARAGVDSAPVKEDADRLAEILRQKGYLVSPAPGR